MLRHIETCEGFKAYSQGEYRKLFSRSSDPRPSFHEDHQSLRMTLGQLDFLKSQTGEAGQPKVAHMSAEMVETVLRSWCPIVKPGVEEVFPCGSPPVRAPSLFGPVDRGSIVARSGQSMTCLVPRERARKANLELLRHETPDFVASRRSR